MNMQHTRQGKLQVELDRAQLGTLIWALHRTAATTLDARQRAEASDMAAWLVRRGARRWGGTSGNRNGKRGQHPQANPQGARAHLAACPDT